MTTTVGYRIKKIQTRQTLYIFQVHNSKYMPMFFKWKNQPYHTTALVHQFWMPIFRCNLNCFSLSIFVQWSSSVAPSVVWSFQIWCFGWSPAVKLPGMEDPLQLPLAVSSHSIPRTPEARSELRSNPSSLARFYKQPPRHGGRPEGRRLQSPLLRRSCRRLEMQLNPI